MPHVRISVGDIKCVRQADDVGKDDVYWLSNLRHGRAVDDAHTNLARLIFDTDYDTSLPEMLSIGAGETGHFGKNVIYDADCPAGSYVFGTVHFMERDTPLANYFAKIAGIVGVIVAGLVVGGVIGFGVGFGLAGLAGAIGGGLIVIVGIAVVGFIVGAAFELVGADEGDDHLGGMRVVVGPLADPPPDRDSDTWALTMSPAGKLEVVDAHGAELVVYTSTHAGAHIGGGHFYETSLRLEITGGRRAVSSAPAAVAAA